LDEWLVIMPIMRDIIIRLGLVHGFRLERIRFIVDYIASFLPFFLTASKRNHVNKPDALWAPIEYQEFQGLALLALAKLNCEQVNW